MKFSKLILLLFVAEVLMPDAQGQNVGIGTQDPKARLHVLDSSVVFSAAGLKPLNPGNAPTLQNGRRMMWYAARGAFRAGYGNASENSTIGDYSTGLGFSAIATDFAAFAVGRDVKALSTNTVAIGYFTEASANLSHAYGNYCSATGFSAIAIGHGIVAKARDVIALGSWNDSISSSSNFTPTLLNPIFIIGNGDDDQTRSNALLIRRNGNVGIGTNTPNAKLHIENGSIVAATTGLASATPAAPPASGSGRRILWYSDKAAFRAGYVEGAQWDISNIGNYSWAGGFNAQAGGHSSIALGNGVSAVGANSVVMGRNVAASGKGSFTFGDDDPNGKGLRGTISDNLFWTRFNGGYYFVSSDAGADIGVRVLPGGNSWTTISDQNLKENFEPVDGEALLQKLANIPQYTWNYKGQDPKSFRHYGPMAQDFYKAFGKDDYGTIGCDSLINQHDFIGVNMVAIKALEKRTSTLQKQLDEAMQLLQEATVEIKRLKQKP